MYGRMPKYVALNEISPQQEDVMRFIIQWVRTKKTPVPRKEIIAAMQGVPLITVKWSLSALLAKGYIRKAWSDQLNITAYVQLRTI